MPPLYHALITTHHITSRRKVQSLRQSARRLHPLCILLCSGGSPGIMYAEGGEKNVEEWVAAVKALKYKDFRLAVRPAPVPIDSEMRADVQALSEEVGSVKEFATEMDQKGLWEWWRKGMGYVGP